jgi:ferredoxin
LGFLSRFSLLKINIDSEKCNACGLCSRRCKAACIDGKNHTVDYSRCVACFDCVDTCTHGAISYGLRRKSAKTVSEPESDKADSSRRSFITVTAALAGAAAMKAADKTVDGGMAVILDKQIPERKTPIVPPGAKSLRNVADRCTGCQLCVQACPNGVLRPSGGVLTLMQPTSSYERGYCRPECTACSDVCPAGAIEKIDVAEKSSIQIGHAVWIRKNCIPVVNGDSCGNCARHCPVGAITMVPLQPDKEDSPKIPAVNTERCIGCGACENLCPARPFSAIYVEGHEVHRKI